VQQFLDMKLLQIYSIIFIAFLVAACGAKNENAAPGDSSIASQEQRSSSQSNSGGIRGMFICQNPDKLLGMPPNLEFRSDDFAMAWAAGNTDALFQLQYKREGNFIYFLQPTDLGMSLFLTNIRIVSSSRLEKDATDDDGKPITYVWVKSK
jgi:hypothetical protein